MHAKEQKTLWTDHVAVNVAILKRIYSLSRAYVCSLTKKFYFYLLGDLKISFIYIYLYIIALRFVFDIFGRIRFEARLWRG